MPDLDALTAFAREHRHNLTGPLLHSHVETLAQTWFPEIFFHEDERFHPVDLTALFTVPPVEYAAMDEAERQEFGVPVAVGVDPDLNPIFEIFEPPVVFDNGVRGSGATAVDALDDIDVGRGSSYTHGSNLRASVRFFGASETVNGNPSPSPDDPRRPRHLPIVVRAEMRILLEALKHELDLDTLPSSRRPIDAIWSGFEVEGSFFRALDETFDRSFMLSRQRDIIRAIIQAHENGERDPVAAVADLIPVGWEVVRQAWEVTRDFGFLEFYLVYAFNDYREYGTWPFENEHEGDVEGCCVVFERRHLEQFAAGNRTVERVVPHSLMTAAHEEDQGLDDLKKLPSDRTEARADLRVYVAAGSHGSYTSPGPHDLLDFGATASLPQSYRPLSWFSDRPPVFFPSSASSRAWSNTSSMPRTAPPTTASRSAPSHPPSDSRVQVDKLLTVTPLSDVTADLNIYQPDPPMRTLLALRGFLGTWGGDEGSIDKSPVWTNKTARFFRRFVKSRNTATTPEVD